ncbi:MAG: ABC transporter ATP-binding protein [Actinomycetota bacterium]
MLNQGFSAREISKAFGALQVLDNVSLNIKPRETVGLLGPNGAGKTTLINIIAGYEKQDGGTVTIDGVPLDNLPPDKRARAGIARTFQSGRLFNSLTVAENIALGALGIGESRKVAEERARSIIEILGLGNLTTQPAGSLSHGNARLVGLARAVASQPKYLIMDEPAAGLNESEVPGVLEALATIRNNIGCGMFLVDHNVGLVAEACNRVIVLATGVIIFDGTPQDALTDLEVKSAYLGDATFGKVN